MRAGEEGEKNDETFRIDECLNHVQVIADWLKTLGITHLIAANDEAAVDGMR